MATETQAKSISREESIAELRKTIGWAMRLSETIKTIADMFAEEKSLEEVRAYSSKHFGKIASTEDLIRVMAALTHLFGNEGLANDVLNANDEADFSHMGLLLSQVIMGADMPQLRLAPSAEDAVAAGERTLNMLDKLPMDWQTHADGEEMIGINTGARIEGIGLDVSAPICKCEAPCHHFDIRTSLNSMNGPTIEVGCCKCGTYISRPMEDVEFFVTGGILNDGEDAKGDGVSRGVLRLVKQHGEADEEAGASAPETDDDAG